MPDDLSSLLSPIRERGYRNGATGAECARLSDAAAVDIPRLLAAVEAALKLAEDWDAEGLVLRAGVHEDCARELREAITTALAGEDEQP